jgi:hypothetical protein
VLPVVIAEAQSEVLLGPNNLCADSEVDGFETRSYGGGVQSTRSCSGLHPFDAGGPARRVPATRHLRPRSERAAGQKAWLGWIPLPKDLR